MHVDNKEKAIKKGVEETPILISSSLSSTSSSLSTKKK